MGGGGTVFQVYSGPIKALGGSALPYGVSLRGPPIYIKELPSPRRVTCPEDEASVVQGSEWWQRWQCTPLIVVVM